MRAIVVLIVSLLPGICLGQITITTPGSGGVSWASITGKPASANAAGFTNGANMDNWALKTIPSGTVVGTSDAQLLTSKQIQFIDGSSSSPAIYWTGGTNPPGIWRSGGTISFNSNLTNATFVFNCQNGTLTAGLGSTSVATYNFNNDPNTGLYSPGSDQVSLVAGGIASLTATASGVSVTTLVVGSPTAISNGASISADVGIEPSASSGAGILNIYAKNAGTRALAGSLYARTNTGSGLILQGNGDVRIAGDNITLESGGGSIVVLKLFSSDSTVSAQTGDFATATAGKTLKIKSGSNAMAGSFTLTAGAATVPNTGVDANSVIMTTVKTVGGTQGNWLKIVPTASTGFAVTSENPADTSTYNYVILKVN